MNKKWVYLFAEGDATMRDLLGGKGGRRRRDDQRRPAGAPRIHHHNRSVQRLLPRTRRLPARVYGTRCWRRWLISRCKPARDSETQMIRFWCRYAPARNSLCLG